MGKGKYHGSIVLAIDDNSRRQCKVKGCTNKRYRISGYCAKHTTPNNRYGDPSGMFLKSVYEIEKDEVAEIINMNLNHSGIKHAIGLLDRWLENPNPLFNFPRRTIRLIQDLKATGVTGLDLLIEAAAVWLLADRRPDIVKTNRHLTHALGHKVIKTRAFDSTHVNGTDARAVGEFIRKSIGVLLVNITRAVNKKEAEKQARLQKYGQALKT